MFFINNRKGMTLVEILITLSIIALVAVMVIPSFNMATRKTRRAICLNNLRILQGSADTYSMDEKVSDLVWVSQDDLITTGYLKEKVRCPEGNAEYNSFIIRDGPVCPNLSDYPGHKLGE